MWTKPLALAAGILALGACEPTVMTLDVGTCFDDPESFDAVADVPTVDCAEPHDNEVYAKLLMTNDAYPGDSLASALSGDMCLEEFEGFIGFDYQSSLYEIGWLNPSEETWEIDDREVICFVFHMEFEKVRGTLRGVGE